jgi:hypothetical protein
VRLFGSDRPRTGHAQGAVCCFPAKHSAGSKLGMSLPQGKLLQKALTRDKSPVRARGVRIFRRRRKRPAGADARRARDDLCVQNVGRNAVWSPPFEIRRKISRVCRLRFTLWARRLNHRMAGSVACVPIRRMNRIMLRNCRCLLTRRILNFYRRNVWCEPLSIFARNGCTPKQPRSLPIGKDTVNTHKNASDVPERYRWGRSSDGTARALHLIFSW